MVDRRSFLYGSALMLAAPLIAEGQRPKNARDAVDDSRHNGAGREHSLG